MIGIAKTGSGKTAAFIWPMLVHIMDQKELEPGEGPIAIIVCPTRELCQQVRNLRRFETAWFKYKRCSSLHSAEMVLLSMTINIHQIHAECKRFGKAYSLRSVAVYGGGSMWEQAKALQEGAEIVVCTPVRKTIFFSSLKTKFSFFCCEYEFYSCLFIQGRLIDHVKKKATSLQRVTYLVFDEADRMFDMGFGELGPIRTLMIVGKPLSTFTLCKINDLSII